MKLFNYIIAIAVVLCGAQAIAGVDSADSHNKKSEMNSMQMNDQMHKPMKDRKSDRMKMNKQKNAQYSKAKIKNAQKKLKDNGYTVSADGVAGQETRKAVKKFQKEENLEVSGNLNPETMQALGLTSQMDSSDERTRRPASVKGTQKSSDFEEDSEMRDDSKGDIYDENE